MRRIAFLLDKSYSLNISLTPSVLPHSRSAHALWKTLWFRVWWYLQPRNLLASVVLFEKRFTTQLMHRLWSLHRFLSYRNSSYLNWVMHLEISMRSKTAIISETAQFLTILYSRAVEVQIIFLIIIIRLEICLGDFFLQCLLVFLLIIWWTKLVLHISSLCQSNNFLTISNLYEFIKIVEMVRWMRDGSIKQLIITDRSFIDSYRSCLQSPFLICGLVLGLAISSLLR